MYRKLLTIVVLMSLAAATGFLFLVITESVVDDFGIATVSYGDRALLNLDDPAAERMTVTAFFLDPSGEPVPLGTKSGSTSIPIDAWAWSVASSWSNVPDDLGVGILLVVDAKRTGLRHCTMVAAVPLRASLIAGGKMPNVTLAPLYLDECSTNGPTGPWELAESRVGEAMVPVAMVLSDSVLEEVRLSLYTSSRPRFLGAGILVGDRYVGPLMAWFTRKHDVSVSASGSWRLCRGMGLYARAKVGYLLLNRNSTTLRIPIFLPEVELEGNTWKLRITPGPPDPGYVSSILSPTESKGILVGENFLWLQNAGMGEAYMGPVLELDPLLGTEGLRATLVGPLLNLRVISTEINKPRYFTTNIQINQNTIDVPSFIILI